MAVRLELPSEPRKKLDHYFHLKVGDWDVRCPYFMNVRGQKNLPPVYAGKGSPEEIEKEAKKNLNKGITVIKDGEDARHFLILCGLGIDCSGLVANVLGTNSLKQPSILRDILAKFRPRTNISANLLTGNLNSNPVTLAEIKPGDLIRQGKRHVMLVEWVERIGNKVTKVGYVESNSRPEWGVQIAEIHIVDPKKPLEGQKWTGIRALKRYLANSDRGIVRSNNF